MLVFCLSLTTPPVCLPRRRRRLTAVRYRLGWAALCDLSGLNFAAFALARLPVASRELEGATPLPMHQWTAGPPLTFFSSVRVHENSCAFVISPPCLLGMGLPHTEPELDACWSSVFCLCAKYTRKRCAWVCPGAHLARRVLTSVPT